MAKEDSDIIPEEFLEELVQSINEQFGWPENKNEGVNPLD